MSEVIRLKIDVSKIDKSKLYKGAKGIYLDAVLFLNDEIDQYGNNGMIVQQVTKEEREQGVRGAILGNSSKVKKRDPESLTDDEDDDLPF